MLSPTKASHWRKLIAQPGQIRVVLLEATALMHELSQQQLLIGQAQVGFSEAVVGTLLIASGHKASESINMNVQGSALYKQAIVDASPDGKVRGFLILQEDKSRHTFGAEGHNGPWGSGILSILYTKSIEGKIPYTGMVPLSTGILDEAINDYYRDSEQLTSKVALNVVFQEGKLKSVSGVLVQALGGASESEREAILNLNVETMRKWLLNLNWSDSSETAVTELLPNSKFETLKTEPVEAFCTCSQERIERALVLTGEEDIIEALSDDPVMTVTCDFCRHEYKLAAERVRALFKQDPSRLQ